MLTTIAAGRVFDFSHAVGRGALSGMGFRMAVALALGQGNSAPASASSTSGRGRGMRSTSAIFPNPATALGS
jgi:hypothetical protein